jgi:cytochrome c-type biogenesis protein CcmH/NrfG
MMIQSLEQEIQKHPDNVELWIQLGNSYFDSNMFQKAVDAYQKALEIEPDNASVLTDMGVMYRRLKQPEKAIEAFDKAASIDPSHEMCRFNKGIVLMHDLNDKDGAIKTWEELVKINPLAKGPNGILITEFIDKIKNSKN